MKKLLKIMFVLTCVFILNILLLLNSINAVNVVNAVTIDNPVITSGGDCGTLLTYKGIIVKTFFAQYQARDGISYPAYCLDKTKQGVTDNIQYSVSVNEAIKDVKLWRYIINGYPYKTIEELNCATREEAYTATKQAIYCYIHGNNPEDYKPIGEAGVRTLNALKMIVNNANNSNEQMISNTIKIEAQTNFFEQDRKDLEYVSKIYKISCQGQLDNYKISIKKGQTDLIEGIKITDINNIEKQEFSSEESFKILLPIKYLNKEGDFKIHVTTRVKSKPVLYGASENSIYQDYALTAGVYEDTIEDLVDEFSKNSTKLKIIKQDKETKERLQGVKFELLNDKKEVLYSNLITDEDGVIEIPNLLPGKYYIKEINPLNGYIENEELIDVSVGYNEILTVEIDNLKEEKPKEELKEEKISSTLVKETKTLPVTGM